MEIRHGSSTIRKGKTMITINLAVLGCIGIVVGIIAACWLADLKILAIDIIVYVIAALLIMWVIASAILPALH
jgi:hypothetical protein